MAKGFARLGLTFLSVLTAGTTSAATVGDLLVSEVMVNPAAVSDTRGEWFELYNPTSAVIQLGDVTLHDTGTDFHRITSELSISPGQFLTLARSGDFNLNGGLSADYVYDNFVLGNAGDEIILSRDASVLLQLEYDGEFAQAGRSRELIGLPMRGANFNLTLATLTYGLGDIGSPGRFGGAQPTLAAVPLPAAAGLFTGGVVMLASIGRFSRRNHVSTPA